MAALTGCLQEEKPAGVRFITESLSPQSSSIEFSDGASVRIECIQIDAGGGMQILWEDTLEPRHDGLGNTIHIMTEPELAIWGRGSKPFSHSIPDLDPADIDHFTKGRSASLDPTNIVWVCMFTKGEDKIPPDSIPTLPMDVDQIAAVAKEYQAEAIVLRASTAGR